MSLLSAALVFFLIMDPFGNVPLFLAALRTTPKERRQWVILRECLIAFGIMVAFLFGGAPLVDLLHIDASALEAAGGVILLLIAIRMVFPTPERNLKEATLGEPFIVPLAVPYIAGPSLLAMVVVLVSQDSEAWPVYLGALAIAWAVTTLILFMSGFLLRVVGERTLVAVERLMGMLLVILAIQMMLNGTKEFFAG
ncbi:MAG TPA: MarC family protein [Actinomycetaceae bacterium]|nr:MarC family protein [Actinomycetaceae bacterium]